MIFNPLNFINIIIVNINCNFSVISKFYSILQVYILFDWSYRCSIKRNICCEQFKSKLAQLVGATIKIFPFSLIKVSKYSKNIKKWKIKGKIPTNESKIKVQECEISEKVNYSIIYHFNQLSVQINTKWLQNYFYLPFYKHIQLKKVLFYFIYVFKLGNVLKVSQTAAFMSAEIIKYFPNFKKQANQVFSSNNVKVMKNVFFFLKI